MAFLNLKSVFVCSVLIVVFAIIYKKRSDGIVQKKLGRVLGGLLRAEKKVGVDRKTKIALGFGGCEDIFVNAQDLLSELNYDVPDEHVYAQDIKSASDFVKTFTYFFGEGAAAE